MCYVCFIIVDAGTVRATSQTERRLPTEIVCVTKTGQKPDPREGRSSGTAPWQRTTNYENQRKTQSRES